MRVAGVVAGAEFDRPFTVGFGTTVFVITGAGADATGAEAAVDGEVSAARGAGSSFVISTTSQVSSTRMTPTATPPRAASVALPRSFRR